MKGQALGLIPLYLQDEERISALVRWLGLALRGLSVLQYRVRQYLAKTGTKLGAVCGAAAANHEAAQQRTVVGGV